MNLCFASMTMREWLGRKATGGCLAGKRSFISSEIHYSFLVILFSSLCRAISRMGLIDQHYWTSNQIHTQNRWFLYSWGWLKQIFNSVCINRISLSKAINFVFRAFLKFILWGVCCTYMCMCTSACVCTCMGWPGTAASGRLADK